MKNILLAGHGSIGKAFETIYRQQGETDNLIVCDIKNGCDCRDYIRGHGKDIDIIVNLTAMQTGDILPLCLEKGIDYIDAAIEDDSAPDPASPYPPLYQSYMKLVEMKAPQRVMLGFGMNPGIIEYIYFTGRPQGKHIALEFEYDSAKRGGERFGTWSPYSYFMEASHNPKILSTRKYPAVDLAPDMKGKLPISLPADGKMRDYLLIPHEESFSVMRNSPDCMAFAFLYQGPGELQKYYLEHGASIDPESLYDVPVLHDITGVDSVGILFYDGKNAPYYVRNTSDHAESFRRNGCNATCWQTASGVYAALKLLPLLNRGEVVTMADVSLRFKDEIASILNKLGFVISRTDNAMENSVFEEKVLSWMRKYI